MRDTIFALSSGFPPAGIAVIRISGGDAATAIMALAAKLPAPRYSSLAWLKNPDTSEILDQAMILWLPGPKTVTGEDVAELHVHGGRAVVAAILAVLGAVAGLRPALAGEFTRRAFENGRIDLAEAEGLADLLAAETEAQRQSALALAEGGLGRKVSGWQSALLRESALVEAALDFSDESDVGESDAHSGIVNLAAEIAAMLDTPPAERLKDGVRVVLAGPPNSGKSSLFNYLVDRDAAIVSEIAGTTRDRIEASVLMNGVALLLIDTAGLRESDDVIESLGIARAGEAVDAADIVLWLGDVEALPAKAILVAAKSDLGGARSGLCVSVRSGEGLDALRSEICNRAALMLPRPGALALHARHRTILADVLLELQAATAAHDPLIIAEHLRVARLRLDAVTGRAGVEDMLDALFGAFCIGK